MNLGSHLKDKIFEVTGELATARGKRAFVIGGYVRDILLGKSSKDIDFVVEGSGIELAMEVATKLKLQPPVVFKNFGTAMLRYKGMEIEFVGARRESYRASSRKPLVENGTIEDDQLRRDFTVNALAASVTPDNFGELTDPFDGLSDLQKGIIRTPLEPGITFSDDPLRMMRAVRFACRLGFKIDPLTFSGISEKKERLSIVSAERITDELNKIILADKPSAGFVLLDESGLLEYVLPRLAQLKGVDVVNGDGHKDNFYHTLGVLDRISENTDDLWLRWAALLHDIAKPQTRKYSPETGWTFHGHEVRGVKLAAEIFKQRKLPIGDKLRYVQKLIFLHLRPIALAEEGVTDSALRRLLFEAGEDIDDLMTLCRADITSGNRKKVNRILSNFTLVEQRLRETEEKDRLRNWQPPVSGELIMETFGIPPCREVGIIKTAIREAILDGQIGNNYEEAYRLMLEEGKKIGLKAAENL